MRIALAVPGGVDRSGTERVIPCLLWLIEALVRDGHDVQVFASRQEPQPASWKLLGAQVHNLAGKRSLIATFRALLQEHRKEPFDALHALWANGGGLATTFAGRILNVPSVLTLAGGELVAYPDISYGGRRTASGRAMVWAAMRFASHVTAPSEYVCRRAAQLGIEAIHVPLGVDIDRWPPKAPRLRKVTDPIHLLHVASLNRVKDQKMLLQAAQRLMQLGVKFDLMIIGGDTLDGEVHALADSLGLRGLVHFMGFLPHSKLRPHVESADVLVMTSRHEAGPLVTLEAAIVGVPTIGTPVGHIADFAPDAAIVTPAGDQTAMANAIRSIAQDETMRMRIATEAQRRALAHDADNTMRRFCELYERRTVA